MSGHIFKDPGMGMGVSYRATVLFPWEQFPKSEDSGASSATGIMKSSALVVRLPWDYLWKENRAIKERPRKRKAIPVRMKMRTMHTYIRLYSFALFFLIITTAH